MSVVLQTGVMRYRENENDSWHPLIIKADMNLEALIDEYDATATKTWVAGELCSHDGLIYSCKSGITTPKAWTAGDWDLTDFGEEISELKEKVGSASLTTTAQNLSDGVNELKTSLNQLALRGTKTAISANGTVAFYCTGLTTNHRVCNWGLFSDVDLTIPLDPNNPPADITITENAGAYSIKVENITTAFYIQPTFILPQ